MTNLPPATPIRGRLAPSPTGGLHIGNARTLLLAWLSARAAGGRVTLRVEDLDEARCKPGYAAAQIDDLRWLGLDWDEGPDVGGPHAPYEQSRRRAMYRATLARLHALGLAYPCICSRADLAGAASAPHGPGGPRYPGTCRDRFASAVAAEQHAGRPAAWRFDSRRLPRLPWRDGFLAGALPDDIDDFVLWRADGVAAYQLAVVVDDVAMGITEVVRGADLVDSTPRQLALFAALGGHPPRYAHVPLVLDERGERLAKRRGSTQIAALRQLDVSAARLRGWLGHGLGLLATPAPVDPATLVARFAWSRVSAAPLTVREPELLALAARD